MNQYNQSSLLYTAEGTFNNVAIVTSKLYSSDPVLSNVPTQEHLHPPFVYNNT